MKPKHISTFINNGVDFHNEFSTQQHFKKTWTYFRKADSRAVSGSEGVVRHVISQFIHCESASQNWFLLKKKNSCLIHKIRSYVKAQFKDRLTYICLR